MPPARTGGLRQAIDDLPVQLFECRAGRRRTARDDPVRVERVVEGVALTQEFRIGDDLHAAQLALLKSIAGPDRDGRPHEHDRAVLRVPRDLRRCGLDLLEVGHPGRAHRRAHRDDDDVGESDVAWPIDEADVDRPEKLFEPRLLQRIGPAAPLPQSRRVPLDAGHLVSEIGEDRRRGRADVPGADDDDPHPVAQSCAARVERAHSPRPVPVAARATTYSFHIAYGGAHRRMRRSTRGAIPPSAAPRAA